ncbi:MAG: PEPxxWA-CTERM sorting domain-containing protein [Roseateles sp.]
MGIPALPPGTVRPTDALPGVTPAVPEPGTWAMLIAGLALLGWRTRQRRS